MATRSVDLKVNASGLNEAVKSAEKLDKILSKLGLGASSSQSRSSKVGSRAADAALNSLEDGLSRGTAAGANRGDSRDFARQAQGLGGLVHVYATFAANVFAVSAAFNALSKAMDFTIMQKSADILSGSLGVSLNNTAKALREVVDGAISARQALEMTNMGATAGLTTKQMKDLATTAKGASLALGRDLEDAMNRVFKGAIKIEPELLDELGIMVKVNDATKEYARTLNKSALELTDFERRQAFVNAVAKQGIDKYSELTQQVNPYSKLLASLNDTLMAGAGALNTVLGPIANFLANNTAALVGALTLIASTLLGMAIPAIKSYGEAWKKQTQETIAGFKSQISAIEEQKKKLIDQGTGETRISRNLVAALGEENNISGLLKTKGIMTKAETKNLYKQFVEGSGEAGLEAGKKLLAALQAQVRDDPKTLKSLEAKFAKNTPDKILVSQEAIEIARGRADSLNKIIGSLQTALIAIDTHHKKVSEAADAELKKIGGGLPALEKKLHLAQKISDIIGVTETAGIRAGFGALAKEVSSATGLMDKLAIGSKGAFGILGGALTGIVSKIGWAGAIIGTLTEVGTLVLNWTGGLTNRSAEASKAIDELNENIKALSSSMDHLSNANSLDKIFTYNKGAASNLLNTLNSIVEASKKLENLKVNGGWFEKGWESLTGSKQKDLGKDSAKFFEQAQKLGLVDDNFLQERFGVKEDRAGYRTLDKESGKWIEAVTPALEVFKKKVEDGSIASEKLSNGVEVLLEKTTKLSNAYQELELSVKDMKKYGQEYVNSLMPQNLGGNLLRTFSNGTKSASEAFNITGDLSGIYKVAETFKDISTIAGIEVPEKLKGMVSSLSAAEKSMKASGLDSASINKALTEKMKNDGIPALAEFSTFTVASSKKLFDLANSANDTSINLSNLSAAMKKLDYFRGKGLSTEAGERAKIGLENAQVSAQIAPLRKELEILKEIQRSNADSKGITGGYTDAKDVMAAMDSAVEKNNVAELIKLQGIYQGLLQTNLAINTKSAQIKALEANYVSKAVAEDRTKTARLDEIKRADERAIALKQQALETDTNSLELKKVMGSILIEQYDISKRELDFKSQMLALEKELVAAKKAVEKSESSLALAPAGAKKDIEETLKQQKLELDNINLRKKAAQEADKVGRPIADANSLLNIQVRQLDLVSQKLNNVKALYDAVPGSLIDQKNTLATLLGLNERIADSLATQYKETQKLQGLDPVEKQKKLLELEAKQLSNLKDRVSLAKEELDIRLKAAELGKGSVSTSDMARAFADETEQRVKAMQSSTSVLFKGFFDAANNSIDKLADMMKNKNLNWKDAKEAIRESLATMMRDTIANQLKNSFTNLVANATKALGGKSTADIEKERLAARQTLLEESTLSYYSNSLITMQEAAQMQVTSQQESTSRIVEAIGRINISNAGTTTGFITGADNKLAKRFSQDVSNASGSMSETGNSLKFSAQAYQFSANKTTVSAENNLQAAMRNAGASDAFVAGVGQWGNAAFGFLSDLSMMMTASAGGGKNNQWKVLGMNLLNGAIAGAKAWAGGSASSGSSTAGLDQASTGAYTSSGIGNSSNFYVDVAAKGGIMSQEGLRAYSAFASGGIMSEYGPLTLHKYSNGGIATGPRAAIYGEGRKAEAYVPLPDNRTIPVTLSGGTGGEVNNVTVNVTVNTGGGDSKNSNSTGSDANKQFGNNLAKQVTFIVQEQLVQATRPGGLLYNRK